MGLVGGFIEGDSTLADGKIGFFRFLLMVRTAWNVHTLQSLDQPLEIHVSIDEEYGIVGTVVTLDESEGIGGGVLSQLLRLAEDVMAEGVACKEDILELIIDQFGRRVVITLDLITDHLYFLVDLVLRILAMEYNVSQHVYSLEEVLLGYG